MEIFPGLDKSRTLVVDSNAFGNVNVGKEAITKMLYLNDPNRLELFDDDFTAKTLAEIRELIHFVHISEVVIIPEVLEEKKEFVRQVDRHADFLRGNNSYAIRLKKDGSYDNYISNISQISEALFDLYKSVNRKEKHFDWSINPANEILSQAHLLSGNIDSIRRRTEKQNMEHAINLGDRLGTDQKLATVSFLCSYQNPTTLVTGDFGLIGLVKRLNGAICIPSHKRMPGSGTHERLDNSDLHVYSVGEDVEFEIYHPYKLSGRR